MVLAFRRTLYLQLGVPWELLRVRAKVRRWIQDVYV